MTKILTARLDELEHDPVAIEGHEARLTQLDDLLASLPVEGQLQSLSVRPYFGGKPKKGPVPKWSVRAGNRRLAALRKLRDSKGSIEGVKVTDAFEVHVIVKESDDAATYAASRAENLMRLPETPVEEFRAFAKMAVAMPPKEIAARFGISEKRVKQRLTLAALHEDVLDALDKGKITMEAAEAFTLQPDPKKQAEYLKKSNSYQLQAYSIKSAFTQKLVRGDGTIARLIGKKAYVAAGGAIHGDAFDDKASYWISPKIIDKLLAAHWADQKKAWLEAGWLFVETAAEFCGKHGLYYIHRVDQLDELPGKLPAADEKKAQALRDGLAALRKDWPWLDDDNNGMQQEPPEKIESEFRHLEGQLEKIERSVPAAYTPAQKGLSGVVYFEDGSQEPRLGMVKEGTVVPVELGGRGADDDDSQSAAADLLAPGYDTVRLLTATLDAGLSLAIGANPTIALQILIATLLAGSYESPLQINREYNIDPEDEDGANDPKFVDALASLDGKAVTELVVELARVMAPGFALNAHNADAGAAVIKLAKPIPKLDAEAYFATLSKPLLQLAWSDMRSPLNAAHKGLADGKVADMAKAVTALAFDTKWLPPQLRTPSYSGPCFVTAKSAEAEDDEQLQAAE